MAYIYDGMLLALFTKPTRVVARAQSDQARMITEEVEEKRIVEREGEGGQLGLANKLCLIAGNYARSPRRSVPQAKTTNYFWFSAKRPRTPHNIYAVISLM